MRAVWSLQERLMIVLATKNQVDLFLPLISWQQIQKGLFFMLLIGLQRTDPHACHHCCWLPNKPMQQLRATVCYVSISAIAKWLCVNKLEKTMKQPMVNNSLTMNHLLLCYRGLPSAISKKWAINLFGEKDLKSH